jgi:hypothetical protein
MHQETGTNLVVITPSANPVMVSVRDVSYENIQKMMELEERQPSIFPGKAYNFKKGHWFEGFGKDAPLVDKQVQNRSVIINAPNTIFAWRIFTEDGIPSYLEFANPSLGQRLSERRSLGHNDKTLWEVKEFNGVAKAMDPISKIAMLPFRWDGDDEVHHLLFASWSGVRAVQDFLKTYAVEGRKHAGKLPVVNLGSKLERHWENESATWETPTFEIADWETPTKADEPEGAVSAADMAKNLEVPADGGVTAAKRTASSTSERTEQTVEKIKETAQRTVKPVEKLKEQAAAVEGEPNLFGGDDAAEATGGIATADGAGGATGRRGSGNGSVIGSGRRQGLATASAGAGSRRRGS